MPTNDLEKDLKSLIAKSIKESFQRQGISPKQEETSIGASSSAMKTVVAKAASLLKEASALLPKSFVLKTQWLSAKAKGTHEKSYHGYIKNFNEASIKLGSFNKEDLMGFRALKGEETHNLNAVKLHELYFGNISDQHSEIHRDSLPYMRLARDWGSFENWQFDFIATAMTARDGWVMVCLDPFTNKFMNIFLDGHSQGVPVCAIPILVLDVTAPAYMQDFADDKKSYIHSMMREFNWSIIEARMVVAERANLKDLYAIRILIDNTAEKMVTQASNQAPIGSAQVVPGGVIAVPAPGADMQVNARLQEKKMK